MSQPGNPPAVRYSIIRISRLNPKPAAKTLAAGRIHPIEWPGCGGPVASSGCERIRWLSVTALGDGTVSLGTVIQRINA
jgi:hypothetical protein